MNTIILTIFLTMSDGGLLVAEAEDRFPTMYECEVAANVVGMALLGQYPEIERIEYQCVEGMVL